MGLAYASEYNDMMNKIRKARDKYKSGFVVGENVTRGTKMTAKQINDAASWCVTITAASPLSYSYPTVSVGQLIKRNEIDTISKNIDAVANCYSNCHSNCHSNCYSDCYSDCDHGCGDNK